MSINIDELIQSFYYDVDNSKHLLQEVLDMVTSGKVPEKELVEKLDISINDLSEKYAAIRDCAREQLYKEEMPPDGSSVQEYALAIKNSKKVEYERKLSEIKQTLKKFIAVKSLVEAYSSALKPYQDQALSLLNRLKNEDTVDLNNVQMETAGPQAFMQALGCSDFDSENNMLTLERLPEHFSFRVCSGVASRKYFVEPEEMLQEPEMSKSVLEELSATSEVANIEAVDISELDQPNNDTVALEDPSIKFESVYLANVVLKPSNNETTCEVTEGAGSVLNRDKEIEGDEEIAYAEESNEIDESSELVIKLIKSHAILPRNYDFGHLAVEKDKIAEEKKITSSVFSGDIRKGNEAALKTFIKEIIKRNYLRREYLVDIKGYKDKHVDASLSYLLKLGYLRKYTLIPGGSFYCPSARLMRAMTFKECSRIIGIRQQKQEDFGEDIEDFASSAMARLAFTKIYENRIKRFIDAGLNSYSESSSFGTEYFILRISSKEGEGVCELLLGAFWTNTDECDDAFSLLKRFLEGCNHVDRFTMAGTNFKNAETLMDVVIEFLDHDLSNTEKYLYSMEDDEFKKYGEKRGIEEFVIDEVILTETDLSGDEVDMAEPVEAEEENDKENTEKEVTYEKIKKDSKQEVIFNENTPKLEKHIVENLQSDNESDALTVICSMLSDGYYYAASAYAKVCDTAGRINHLFYEQLAYALNDPIAHCSYSTDNVYDLISKNDPLEDALIIATAVRTFYSNQIRYDYNIRPFYEGIKGYPLLRNYPELSKVVYSLMNFKNTQKKGIAAYTKYDAEGQKDIEHEFNTIRREAVDFYENFVIGKKKETARQKRFIETKKLLFSKDEEIGIYLKYIVDGNRDSILLIKEFLEKQFFKEESVVSVSTIDNDMLWNYIVRFWEKAGENMMYRRRSDLMGSFRNNITNMTVKAVQILIKWCAVVEKIDSKMEDEGMIAYRRIRSSMLKDLSSARVEIKEGYGSDTCTQEEKAGLSVIINTLNEIKEGIEGSDVESKFTYYYSPFLLTDDVMLDEGFIPDLNMHSCTIRELQPDVRILRHLEKIKKEPLTMRERLSRILAEEEDDYGAASLVIEYLLSQDTDEDFMEAADTVEKGEIYAKDAAKIKHERFIGDIELAQSYGQIDNSYEDKKDKILQIVDEWYEWALETSNYGFFEKVMEAYLEEIRESAKSRETDLLRQVELFKQNGIPGISKEKKDKRVTKIVAAIKEQNYTVAEDLLVRAALPEDDYEDNNDEDFLKDFLSHYENYRRDVSQSGMKFSNLALSRLKNAYNKEERGGRRLVDSWLPGGADLGKIRLRSLLGYLGFKVSNDSITPREKINKKHENYLVFTEKSRGGERGHYAHPIAAFGSGAETEGFRVVCITGSYEADALIDVMKEIGNAKHTLILLDYALPIGQRRKLARKTKNSLGDTLFAVIDRTVMMYLARNYDETKINRMLMSLIIPFGYYQPYVWESASPMPPEIFMGRKIELEKIKAPSGVNIVYGGRQLGKSALLKKAKDEIDNDENGDRAIYIDIKDQDQKEAARKIGGELFDQGILEEDPDTDDWNVLARVIRRRLLVEDKGKKIPYLLLLLDEADAFIESCESIKYAPLDALKEVQNIGIGRFKFVIAGLHNIVRFKRESTEENNSGIPHLMSITVKPFNTFEARELLENPLYYLGMRFPKEKESLISLILATTNYFPGLIQMYCAKLIEAMRNKDYADYNEVNTPIYEVSEEHIKKILADKEFNEQIRQKYFITLKLGEDNYYYIIALLMAYLYHRNGYSEGYTAKDIKAAGTYLEIPKLSDLENEKLSAYMEELRELNVLRSTDDNKYLFTRFTFFQMMGTSDDVEEKLMDYMED